MTQPDFTYDADFFKVLHAPKGAVFVTADTAGTKADDAVADGTLKHLGKVRPALKSMTENELESYSYLFETGMQPHRSSRFIKNTLIGAMLPSRVLFTIASKAAYSWARSMWFREAWRKPSLAACR